MQPIKVEIRPGNPDYANSPAVHPVAGRLASAPERGIQAGGRSRKGLFSTTETDLLTPLRAGASDEAIAHLIIEAVKNKEPGHKINAADFVKPARNMSTIGG